MCHVTIFETGSKVSRSVFERCIIIRRVSVPNFLNTLDPLKDGETHDVMLSKRLQRNLRPRLPITVKDKPQKQFLAEQTCFDLKY